MDINFFDQETNQFGFVLKVPLNILKFLEDFSRRMTIQRKSMSLTKFEKPTENLLNRSSMGSQARSTKSNPKMGVITNENATPLLTNLFSGIKGTVNRKDAEIVGWLYLRTTRWTTS